MDERELLRRYVQGGDQEAFGLLVERYVDIVYAAAKRQVADAHLAEDVTQAVFIILARRSASVPQNRPLLGWLLTTTRYASSSARRARARREIHEHKAAAMSGKKSEGRSDVSAWDYLSPLLDEGIHRLRARDRD